MSNGLSWIPRKGFGLLAHGPLRRPKCTEAVKRAAVTIPKTLMDMGSH